MSKLIWDSTLVQTPLQVCVYMCVCAHMCICTCLCHVVYTRVYVCMHLCVHSCLLVSFSVTLHSFLRQGLSSLKLESPFYLGWIHSGSLPTSAMTWATMPNFLCGYWDTSSGPLPCVASSLMTTAPQPGCRNFLHFSLNLAVNLKLVLKIVFKINVLWGQLCWNAANAKVNTCRVRGVRL